MYIIYIQICIYPVSYVYIYIYIYSYSIILYIYIYIRTIKVYLRIIRVAIFARFLFLPARQRDVLFQAKYLLKPKFDKVQNNAAAFRKK